MKGLNDGADQSDLALLAPWSELIQQLVCGVDAPGHVPDAILFELASGRLNEQAESESALTHMADCARCIGSFLEYRAATAADERSRGEWSPIEPLVGATDRSVRPTLDEVTSEGRYRVSLRPLDGELDQLRVEATGRTSGQLEGTRIFVLGAKGEVVALGKISRGNMVRAVHCAARMQLPFQIRPLT